MKQTIIPQTQGASTLLNNTEVACPRMVLASWKYWSIWVLSISLVLVVLVAVIDVAPYLHIDEFTIVDLGRVVLTPETDWSIAWMTEKNQPVFLIFYLGPVLQELSFQVLGQYGPRLFGIVGAMLAGTAMVGLLITKGASHTTAFILGLVFLLDPLFLQGYTMGRLDGWAMGLCLLSCWLINSNGLLDLNNTFKWRIITSGLLSILALFFWPSSLFLFPLIFLELYKLSNTYSVPSKFWQELSGVILQFSAGCVLGGIILLLPVVSQLYSYLEIALESLLINTRSGLDSGDSTILQKLYELVRVMKYTPFLVIIAFLSIVISRDKALIIAISAVLILMFNTLVYIHRVQYLLPYLVYASFYLLQLKNRTSLKPISPLLRHSVLVALLLWPVVVSLFARTYLALSGKQDRKRDLVFEASKSMIGPGQHSVYLDSQELYYPGRELGWKMFRHYRAYGDTVSQKLVQEVVSKVDYVIIHQLKLEVEKDFLTVLKKEGMHNCGIFQLYDKPAEPFNGVTTNEVRLRNLFSIFPKPYGPYILYAREHNKLSHL